MRVRLEQDGVVIPLTGEPLARGGEAVVWPLPENPALLAKVYHKPTPEHADKLAAMLANPPDDPTARQGHTSIAWPASGSSTPTPRAAASASSCRRPRWTGPHPLFDVYNPEIAFAQTWPLFHYGYSAAALRPQPGRRRAGLARRAWLRYRRPERGQRAGQRPGGWSRSWTSIPSRSAPGEHVFRCDVGKPDCTRRRRCKGASFGGHRPDGGAGQFSRWRC